MYINIIDAVIILFLIAGAVFGYKKGAIQMIAYIIGTIFIIALSWYLKKPVAIFMYTHFPYFRLGGVLKNVYVINILIYQGIAFLLILSILSILLGIIFKFTGILSKIVDKSIILTLPSKIIGTLLGFLEAYIFIFTMLFIFSQFSFSHEILSESKYTNMMLNKTPLTKECRNSYKAFKEIKDVSNDEEANSKAIDVLLKYNIITPKTMKKLIKYGKIKAEDLNNQKESESDNHD